MASTSFPQTNQDPTQLSLMSEQIILVDPNDTPLGPATKQTTHLASNGLLLHRAFSVLLFDTSGNMVLQQRAAVKITFPLYWTNTCCSHPLYLPQEMDTGVGNGNCGVVEAVKTAARRKLLHELGIRPESYSLDELIYLTRIHYKAMSDCGHWGEHEIDYVFVMQKDLETIPEKNEVECVKHVSQDELKAMFELDERDAGDREREVKLTPWFKHIMREFGFKWWDVVLDEMRKRGDSKGVDVNQLASALAPIADPDKIYRFVKDEGNL